MLLGKSTIFRLGHGFNVANGKRLPGRVSGLSPDSYSSYVESWRYNLGFVG